MKASAAYGIFSFLIPVKVDFPERIMNIEIVCRFLSQFEGAEIIIMESGENPFLHKNSIMREIPNIRYYFQHDEKGSLHRTRMMNEMFSLARGNVIAHYDADVLLPKQSIMKAKDAFNERAVDVLYPYGYGQWQRQVNATGREKLLNFCDVDTLADKDYTQFESRFGHVFFITSESYRASGGENEGLVSYGPDDVERYIRYKNLEFKIGRIQDYLYHIEHRRGMNSSNRNPSYLENMKMLDTIKSMDNESLKRFIAESDYFPFGTNIKIQDKG